VLSQGQKRRVVLARLQVTTARLWLLDEPWVALDTAAQSRLTELIHQHMQRGGLVIYTSHQAMALGAHVHVKAVRLQP
jgi:heme exporter protein A